MSARARILLIDDNPDYRLAFSIRLKNEGFEVTAAGSAGEGLRALAAQPFDLILLDLRMPDQKGTAVYAQLRAQPKTADLPVIIFTNDVAADYWQPIAAEQPPKGFVMGKSSDFPVLLSRINELLEAS